MINFLHLFSGIGSPEKALKRQGIPFNLVNYCEFDKYASKSYSLIHDVSEDKNLGDITKVDETKLQNVDMIFYGFPCQDISAAGDMKGFSNADGSKTRSGLFFDALRIIEHCKPKVAIAENVKNLVSKKFSKEFKIVLDSLEEAGYNNYWKILNSTQYGVPQNRERVFIVSIRKDIDNGLFEFPEPYELTKVMGDYLEDEVDEKFYLSPKMVDYILDINDVQSGTKWEGRADNDELNPDIAHTLSVRGAGGNQRAGVSNFIADGIDKPIKVKDLKSKILVVGKTRSGNDRSRIIHPNGVAASLTATDYKQPQQILVNAITTKYEDSMVYEDLRIRKLTPRECWRLMGFDDNDFDKVNGILSNSQLYKQAGNSIVVDVLEELFCMMFDENGELYI